MFLILILCFSVNTLKGQIDTVPQGTIYGVILGENKAPVPFASIALIKGLDSTTLKTSFTDENGNFSFEKLEIGNYLIKASYLGYKNKYWGPFATAEDALVINLGQLQIDPESTQLNEVVISAKVPMIDFKANKVVLNVGSSSLAVGNSALDILQKAPGINVYQDGNISLRGRAGVLVMINDKPTYLSNDQLKTLLKSTPGSSIESIEIINNPGADMDAAGSSGIINIKLKKNQQSGINGTVFLGGGYGKTYKSNTGVNLNYGVRKFNLYSSYYWSQDKMESLLEINRINSNNQTLTHFSQFGDNIGTNKSENFKIGIDFLLTKKNTLGIEFKRNGNSWYELSRNETFISNATSNSDSTLVTNTNVHNKYGSTSYNLSYKYDIDTTGQQMMISLDHSRFDNNQNSLYTNRYDESLTNHETLNSIFRITAPTDIQIWSGKIDYKYVYKEKLTTDFGLKFSQVSNNNEFLFHDFLNDFWTYDPKRSNQFNFNEAINAGYFRLKGKMWGTDIELGLRAEHTRSNGTSIMESKVVDRSYFDLFPSASFNKSLDESNTLSIGYNKRIDRPNYSTLNPFVYFTDPYTFIQGNPFLRPQYTNSFTLSYSHASKLNLSFTYNDTRDFISGIIILDTLTKALYQTTRNIDNQRSYNLNVNKGLEITRWWTSNNNLTIYNNKIEVTNVFGLAYQAKKVAFNFSTINNINLPHSWRFEFSVNYQSSELYGTDFIEPIYSVNLGANRSLFKNKADVKFLINDIFNTSNYKFRSNLDIQKYNFNIKPETRMFRLTFSYKFGNTAGMVPGVEKNTPDETRRVKSSN